MLTCDMGDSRVVPKQAMLSRIIKSMMDFDASSDVIGIGKLCDIVQRRCQTPGDSEILHYRFDLVQVVNTTLCRHYDVCSVA